MVNGHVRTKALGVALSCLGVLVLAGWLLASRQSTNIVASRDDVAATDRSNGRHAWTSIELAAISKKTADIEQRLAELELAGSAKAAKTEEYPEPGTEPSKSEQQLTLEQQVQAIDRSFAGESVDSSWAPEAEAAIKAVTMREEFRGTTVEENACRATFCRVRARHESQGAQDAFEAVLQYAPMGGYLAPSEARDGTIQSVAYFVRREYDSQDHPVRHRDRSAIPERSR